MKKFTEHRLIIFSLCIIFLTFSQNTFSQSTVVIPGTFQDELGCAGDWAPDCDYTRLTDSGSGMWEGTFVIPAGTWEYKVAYDNSWAENYGQDGIPGGPNMILALGGPTAVHFTFSAITHLVDLSFTSTTVTLVGSFQNELGCPGDWMPDCNASDLTYDPNADIWYGVLVIPPGNWEFKVVHDLSWSENYGLGGEPNGANIPLTVSGDKKILFHYNPNTHIVTTAEVSSSVVLTGSFQSELGCAGDWQPDCPYSGLTFNPVSNIWEGEFTFPQGNFEFKVVHDATWAENYGVDGVLNGSNIQLNLASVSMVDFIYNPGTHITTFNIVPVTVVIPGSFQSELGCTSQTYNGDWEPACDFTRLTYDNADQLWKGTFDIPAGYWEFKVALNNSWYENYGAGGVRDGSNIPLYLVTPANITFIYDPRSHYVTLLFNTSGICVNAFYDTNVDGYNDENLPMEGIVIKLTGNETEVSQTTGSDGRVCFVNLIPGIYIVETDVLNTYISTTPDSVEVYAFEPVAVNAGMVCIGGAGAMGKGFWTSKHGKAVFDTLSNGGDILWHLAFLNLRNQDGSHFYPNTYAELRDWMQKGNSQNMAYSLSVQAAILYVNIESGFVDFGSIIYSPGVGYMGTNADFMHASYFAWSIRRPLYYYPVVKGDHPQRAEFEQLKMLLEKANADRIFVQPGPCTGTTASSNRESVQILDESNDLIWPNPSDGKFTLRLGSDDHVLSVRVIDVNGRTVFTSAGNAGYDLQFGEGFNAGVYFVEVSRSTGRTHIKVIKK